MLTSNVSQDRTIPYWDEIRNLSIEDKYSLIAKIESSPQAVTSMIKRFLEEYDK